MVKTKFEVTTKYDYDEIVLQLISSDLLVEIMFVRLSTSNFSNTVDFKIKFDLINLLTKNVSED